MCTDVQTVLSALGHDGSKQSGPGYGLHLLSGDCQKPLCLKALLGLLQVVWMMTPVID